MTATRSAATRQSRHGPAAASATRRLLARRQFPQRRLPDHGAITSASTRSTRTCRCPSTDSWSAGVQRGLGGNMAVEVRYVGTRRQWRTQRWNRTLNYNEFNIVENGFLKEFRRRRPTSRRTSRTAAATRSRTPARRARRRCRRSSRTTTASSGAGRNSALYTGANWTNSTFLGFLAARNPNPFGFASTNATNGLQGTPRSGRTRHRGHPGELLRRQSGDPRRRKRHLKREQDAVQRGAARVAPPLRAGSPVRDELRLRQAIRHRTRPSAVRSSNPRRRQHRRHPARVQVEHRLRPAVRPRPTLRRRQRVVDRIIGGWQVGLVSSCRAARPSTSATCASSG